MKHKLKELDVDFIGGQGPLTKDEEKKISEYLKSRKLKEAKKQVASTRTAQRKKVIA